jgi:hypothetical protein
MRVGKIMKQQEWMIKGDGFFLSLPPFIFLKKNCWYALFLRDIVVHGGGLT